MKAQIWIDTEDMDLDGYEGKWIEESVQLLTKPKWDNLTGKWTALANYYGTLAFIEVRITCHGRSSTSRQG